MKKENSAIRNDCLLDICETTSGTSHPFQRGVSDFISPTAIV